MVRSPICIVRIPGASKRLFIAPVKRPALFHRGGAASAERTAACLPTSHESNVRQLDGGARPLTWHVHCLECASLVAQQQRTRVAVASVN